MYSIERLLFLRRMGRAPLDRRLTGPATDFRNGHHCAALINCDMYCAMTHVFGVFGIFCVSLQFVKMVWIRGGHQETAPRDGVRSNEPDKQGVQG